MGNSLTVINNEVLIDDYTRCFAFNFFFVFNAVMCDIDCLCVQVKDICNELDVRSLCHKILQNVSTLLHADRGSLFLVQGERTPPIPSPATKKSIIIKKPTADSINHMPNHIRPVGCISIEESPRQQDQQAGKKKMSAFYSLKQIFLLFFRC